jgi:HlyD family secretion protein
MKTHSAPAALLAACILLALPGCKADGPVTYQGYVEGEFVYVAGKIAGRLDTLGVARGDVVAAGRTLYVLEHAYEAEVLAQAEAELKQAEDNVRDKQKGLRAEEIDQIVASLRQAEASHALSRLEYDRRVKLYADATIAKEDLDTIRTTHVKNQEMVKELSAKLATGKLPSRLDQIRAAEDAAQAARAVVDQARWNLDQKTQKAGVAGLVYDTLHYQGEWVAAGAPAVVLLPQTNVKARFFVPQAVAGGLSLGREIRVSCDGRPHPDAAVISYISPTVEYTPPVIYSQDFRNKLVIMVEARFAPEVAATMHPGQPLDVTLDPASPGGGK